MDGETKLSSLMDIAEELGITVRLTPAGSGSSHPGGAYVRIGEREMLFLDPQAPLSEQVNAAVEALRGRSELRQRYLPPEIREMLEESM